MKRLLFNTSLFLFLLEGLMASPDSDSKNEKECKAERSADGSHDEPRKSKDKGSRDHEFAKQFFMRLDKDQDGAVSQQEFAANPRLAKATEEQRKLLFQRLDKNDDGLIKRNELSPPQSMRRGDRPKWLENGPVSYEQFAKQPRVQRLNEELRKKLFDRLDQNNDGILSKEDAPRGRGEGPEGRPEGPRREKPHLQEILDADGDDNLSFTEFQSDPRHHDLSEDEVEDRFEAIDTNGDGLLSKEELKAAHRSRDPKKTEQKSL